MTMQPPRPLQLRRRTLPVGKLAAAVLALAVLPGAAGSASAAGVRVQYPTEPDVVVVMMDRVVSQVPDSNPTPFVTVFGDGRVLVRKPSHEAGAGLYQLRLSTWELDRLLSTLLEKRLVELDVGRLLERKRAIEVARRAEARRSGQTQAFRDSDFDTTVIALNLLDYKPDDASPWTGPITKTIRWTALARDARTMRKLEGLVGLAEAAAEIAALAERNDLSRLD